MKRILILTGRYLPGYKDGGPVRTIINLSEAMGDDYDIRIACLDRDHGDVLPYKDIEYNTWNKVGKANVWYVKPNGFTFSLIRKLIKESDLVYCCGFYDDYAYKTLILNRIGKTYNKSIIVASMGTFSEGALSNKSLKKKVFIGICNLLGLFKNVIWSVTSKYEQEDVERALGRCVKCEIAEDLPRTNVPGKSPLMKSETEVITLKVVFISRICPQKNLITAIKCLSKTTASVSFSIFGPQEDAEYWQKCKKELTLLPKNIKWRYGGSIPSEKVQEEFCKHDVFLFPTLGENYGHVIFEALSVGCIPVISDQTPWNFLSTRNAGFVVNVNDLSGFTKAINEVANMDVNTRSKISQNAVTVAKEKVEDSQKNSGYRIIFDKY